MLTVTRYDGAKGRADEPCEWCGSHSLLFTVTPMPGGPKVGRKMLWFEDAHCENGHIRLTIKNILLDRRPTRSARHTTVSER